jgi:hypothetical protein
VQPGERIDSRLAAGVTILMCTVAQCRMFLGEAAELADELIELMVRVEVVLSMRALGAEQIVVQVLGNLAGKHCLAS